MRITHFDPGARAAEIRALAAAPPDVEADVRAILEEVRDGGDAAVRRLTARFDRADVAPERLRVSPREIEAAVSTLDARVIDALRRAIANVRLVARAQVRAAPRLSLPEGQRVELAEVPVRRAAAYVPAGRAPYPSTVVMCAVTARVAGVDELALCAPPGPEGRAHPVILAACGLCGVNEVYRMGGAQAIAALAYGTESVAPVDVVVGPGNAYVQEAKRQLAGRVGIDGVAGPSELVVVAGSGADPELVGLDLMAQAEHGPDSLLAVISDDADLLEQVESVVRKRAGRLDTVADAPLAVVRARGAREAVELANAVAPEHVQLVGPAAEALADRVRAAGAVFVGQVAGTAFGDYVAGTNHVLPTGGAARYASGLSVDTFRRRIARLSMPAAAAGRLAGPGARLAWAEGFPVHGESMARRA